MAKKKSFFGTLLKIGGLAAVTAAVYNNREEIRDFLVDLAGSVIPAKTEKTEKEETPAEEEPRIVIDASEYAEMLRKEDLEDTAED